MREDSSAGSSRSTLPSLTPFPRAEKRSQQEVARPRYVCERVGACVSLCVVFSTRSEHLPPAAALQPRPSARTVVEGLSPSPPAPAPPTPYRCFPSVCVLKRFLVFPCPPCRPLSPFFVAVTPASSPALVFVFVLFVRPSHSFLSSSVFSVCTASHRLLRYTALCPSSAAPLLFYPHPSPSFSTTVPAAPGSTRKEREKGRSDAKK